MSSYIYTHTSIILFKIGKSTEKRSVLCQNNPVTLSPAGPYRCGWKWKIRNLVPVLILQVGQFGLQHRQPQALLRGPLLAAPPRRPADVT